MLMMLCSSFSDSNTRGVTIVILVIGQEGGLVPLSIITKEKSCKGG
jgi:hypothetical protein